MALRLFNDLCSLLEKINDLFDLKQLKLFQDDKKTLWFFFKDIQNIVFKYNGVIFGGYVRDKIVKEFHAKQYYEYCNNESISKSKLSEQYNNPDSHKETYIGRTLMPNDIDIFFKRESDYINFLNYISKKYNPIVKINTGDPKIYIPTLDIPEKSLSYNKIDIYMIDFSIVIRFIRLLENIKKYFLFPIIIDFILNICKYIKKCKYKISLDVFVKNPSYHEHIEPPFGTPDFTSNTLILSKHGLNMFGVFDITKLTSIISEIQHFETTVIDHNTISLYRLKHMLEKGVWKIKGLEPTLIHQVHDISDEELCSICYSNFSNDNYPESLCEKNTVLTKAYRLPCCSTAIYHNTCLLAAYTRGHSAMKNTGICICCKQDIDKNKIGIDIMFITS
jgi:hypothetical protein